MPGCITPTEMVEALKFGVDVIKVFPGSLVGPKYFKDILAPLPHVNIMPTGGVSLDNVDQWFANGAFAIGVGSALVKGSHDEIVEKAEKFVQAVKEARNNE